MTHVRTTVRAQGLRGRVANDGVAVPAGWYPDPNLAPQLRWWDGSGWTEHASNPQQITVNVNTTPPAHRPDRQQYAKRPIITVPSGDRARHSNRMAAAAIDLIAGWGPMIAVVVLSTRIAEPPPPLVLIAFVFGAVYHLLYPARYGQTLGKHLAGIRIQRIDDGATDIGGGAAFGREIVKLIGLYALLLGLVWILVDRNRQGWHDKAVRTVVVETNQPRMAVKDFLAAPFRR